MGRREGGPGLKRGAASDTFDYKLGKGIATAQDPADVEGTSTPDAKDTPSKAFSNNSDEETLEPRDSRSMGIRRGGGSGKAYSSGAFGPVQAVPPMCYGLGSGAKQQFLQHPSHQQMPNDQLLGVSKQHQQQAAAFGAGFAPHSTGGRPQSLDRQQHISSMPGHPQQQAAGHPVQPQKQQPAPPAASTGRSTASRTQPGKAQQRSSSSIVEPPSINIQDDLTRSRSSSSDGSQRHNTNSSRGSRQPHSDQSPAAYRRGLTDMGVSPPMSARSSSGPNDACNGTGLHGQQQQYGSAAGKLVQQRHGSMGELRDQNPRAGWSGPSGVNASGNGIGPHKGSRGQQQQHTPQPHKLPFSKGGPSPLGGPDGVGAMGNRAPPGRHNSNSSLGRGGDVSNRGPQGSNGNSSNNGTNASRPKPLVLPGEDDLLSDVVPPRSKQNAPAASSSLQAQQQQQLLHHQQVLRAAGAHISSSPMAGGNSTGSTGANKGQNVAATKSQQGAVTSMGRTGGGQKQGGLPGHNGTVAGAPAASSSGSVPAGAHPAGAGAAVAGGGGGTWVPAPPPPPPPPPRKQQNVVLLPSQDIRKAPGTLVPLAGTSRSSSYSTTSSSGNAPMAAAAAAAPAQRGSIAGPQPPSAANARAPPVQAGQQQLLGGLQHQQQGSPQHLGNSSSGGRIIPGPMPPPGAPLLEKSASSGGSNSSVQMRAGQQGTGMLAHPLSPMAPVHGVGIVGGSFMGPHPPMHPAPFGTGHVRGSSGPNSNGSLHGNSSGHGGSTSSSSLSGQQQHQQQQQSGSAPPANNSRAGSAAGMGNSRNQGNRQPLQQPQPPQQQQGGSSGTAGRLAWTKSGGSMGAPAVLATAAVDVGMVDPTCRASVAPAVPSPAVSNRAGNGSGSSSSSNRDGASHMPARGGNVPRQQHQAGKQPSRDNNAAAPKTTSVIASTSQVGHSAQATAAPAAKPAVAAGSAASTASAPAHAAIPKLEVVQPEPAKAAPLAAPKAQPTQEPPAPSKASPVVIASCLPEDEDDLLGITPSSSSSAKSAQQQKQQANSGVDAAGSSSYHQAGATYQHGVMGISQPPPPPRKGGNGNRHSIEPAGAEATAAGVAASAGRGNRPSSSSGEGISSAASKHGGLMPGRVQPGGSPYGSMSPNLMALSPNGMAPAVTWATHFGGPQMGMQLGAALGMRHQQPQASPVAAVSGVLHSPQLQQHHMPSAQQMYHSSTLVKPPPSKRLEIVDPRSKSRSQLSDAGDSPSTGGDEGTAGHRPSSGDSRACSDTNCDASTAIAVGLLSV